jgi:homoserine kinase
VPQPRDNPALGAGWVRVPASTSNLGSGFDCIGLALSRYLTAEFVPGGTAGTIRLERRGTLRAIERISDHDDVFLRAFRKRLDTLGIKHSGGTVTVDSEIPVGRGLGSSAAAVVGGLALASVVAGEPVPRELPAVRTVLRDALEWESHLDNVAPALMGGLVAVAHDGAGNPHAFRLPLATSIAFAYAAPGVELETARARAVLPRTVPFGDAVHNLGALAALTTALATGNAELIPLGLADKLHVPYRLALIPGALEAFVAARKEGAWGVTISGAGSGVIALAAPDRAFDVADAMAAAFRRAAGPAGVVFFAAQPDLVGVTGGQGLRKGP